MVTLSTPDVALVGIVMTGIFSAGTAAVGPLVSDLIERRHRPTDAAARAALKAELKAELEAELEPGEPK